jgi:DNA-binding transcriptional MerR regulator
MTGLDTPFPGPARSRSEAAFSVTTISQLSSMTGVTLRALRHYEAEGLLQPFRAQNGGRLYSAGQCEVAWRIVMLRQAGLSLAMIRQHLSTDRKGQDPALLTRTLESRLAEVEVEAARLRRLIASASGGQFGVTPLPRDLSPIRPTTAIAS